MNASERPAEIGRRERKRRERHAAIARAAVELALESGYENVTVDAVCDVADVARSTFFNYYPSRDAAILGTVLPPRSAEETDAALRARPDDLVAGVIQLVVPALSRSIDELSEILVMRQRLLVSQPLAKRHYSYGLIEVQDHLTDSVAQWLTENPERARLNGPARREAVLAVTAAYSAMYAATVGWSRPLGPMPESLNNCLSAARDLRTVLKENPA